MEIRSQLGGADPFRRSLRSLPPLLGRSMIPRPATKGAAPPWNPLRTAPRGKPLGICAVRQLRGNGATVFPDKDLVAFPNPAQADIRVESPGIHVGRPEIGKKMGPIKRPLGIMFFGPFDGPEKALRPDMAQKSLDEPESLRGSQAGIAASPPFPGLRSPPISVTAAFSQVLSPSDFPTRLRSSIRAITRILFIHSRRYPSGRRL
jgi:hypothetical protein